MIKLRIFIFLSICNSLRISKDNQIINENDDLTDYEFVVFTDPQFGKTDKEGEGDGTNWSMDAENVAQMCSELDQNLAFLMCAGDLVHALPVDEGQSNAGSLPALRPAQTYDFIQTMKICPENVPQYFIPGNRDIGNEKFKNEALTGFEMQFMPGFYFFHVGQRYFITLETQIYKLDNNKSLAQREKQNDWLEYIFRLLPRESKKTVFMHTPLYIENVTEIHAADKHKSLYQEHRYYLLDLFDYNNVDSVFSGHTHFENFEIPKFKNVKQYLMTSINYQNTWHSKETDMNYGPDRPSYYKVHVFGDELEVEIVRLK